MFSQTETIHEEPSSSNTVVGGSGDEQNSEATTSTTLRLRLTRNIFLFNIVIFSYLYYIQIIFVDERKNWICQSLPTSYPIYLFKY